MIKTVGQGRARLARRPAEWPPYHKKPGTSNRALDRRPLDILSLHKYRIGRAGSIGQIHSCSGAGLFHWAALGSFAIAGLDFHAGAKFALRLAGAGGHAYL